MFFSGLFAALFTIRAHLASWPPAGTKLDTLQAGIFTIILDRRRRSRCSAPCG